MSNKEKETVEKIRARYAERKITKFDELKALDRRTRRPAEIFAYVLGTLGALILGTGMCLVMPNVIEGYMSVGIGVGLVGIVVISINYFIYKAHLNSRKRKSSAEIFRLSNEILGKA